MLNWKDGSVERRLRVMQSFGVPRSTTNPYIHMLDEVLTLEPGIEHLRFDRRQALFGNYDVLHFHWPETLLGGTSVLKKTAHKLYASALLLRLRWGNVKVVRTMHNIALPSDLSRWERWFLQGIDDLAVCRIALNDYTGSMDSEASYVIPHGHYVDWFANVPRVEAEPDTIGFVGLIRRYKGVENLIEVFLATKTELAETVLRVCGNPTSDAIRQEVDRLAAGDKRVQLDLRYLSEEDFATSIMHMRGVILPYRFMHNSGAVLAALSLGRPVLIPENEMNRTLATEVGPHWIHFFVGDLTSLDVIAFREAVRTLPSEPPRLDAREWSDTGHRHARAYVAASGLHE